MIICIDGGNSRIQMGQAMMANRWHWTRRVISCRCQLSFIHSYWLLGDPEKVMLANVAGVVAANAIQQN